MIYAVTRIPRRTRKSLELQYTIDLKGLFLGDAFKDFDFAYQDSSIDTFYITLTADILTHAQLEFIMSGMVQPLMVQSTNARAEIVFVCPKEHMKTVKKSIQMIQYVQEARLLAMLPANIGTPHNMALRGRGIFRGCPGVRSKILLSPQLRKLGMNLVLAVGESSANKPCVLVVERKVKNARRTVCVVGKGITFDAGGLSIKPIKYMEYMKFDKTGAVYGMYALRACMDNDKNTNFVGVFPFADNVISGSAVRPGDVVKSYSGKTVEIVDPDAEGRLVMADAMSYAAKYKPDILLDLATLTGNAETVNCFSTAYVYASAKEMHTVIEKAGDATGERMLLMPTWPEYSHLLTSKVADIKQLDSKLHCDAYMAAMFLSFFIPKGAKWIHMDLIMQHSSNGIPSGRGVRATTEVIQNALKK